MDASAPVELDCADDSRLWRITGYAVRRTDLALARDFRRHIGVPLGISEVEFSVLELLAGPGGRSQKAIAAALGMSAPALTVVLDRMARAGLLERRRFDGDRRVQLVAATAAGSALQRRASQAADRMEAELRAKLTAGEQATLMRLLGRLRDEA